LRIPPRAPQAHPRDVGAWRRSHRGAREQFSHCRHRPAGAVLGSRKGRGVLSCFLGLADLRGVACAPLSPAPRLAVGVAERRVPLMRLHPRVLIALALLAGAALFLQARGRSEVFPPRLPMASFPESVGNWTGTDVEIPKDVRDVLGPGEFLLRVYRPDDATKPVTDLFIAYFPTQRAGDTIHSPKNCLPGAGWTPVDSRRITLSVEGHAPFVVNRYVIAKGTDRQLVLYWYWAHDRAV